MREPSDETADSVTADAAMPERKCILSGSHGPRVALIRLVPGPDDTIWPDLGSRLPGRGAWVAPDRAMLEAALANGRLKAALSRSLRQPVIVPADLGQRLADGLQRRTLDRLGLEHRAGHLILGSDRIAEWARAGRLHLLLHAADAAADGCGKLDQALRAGGGDMAQVLRVPAGRQALSRALGRENMVHSGVNGAKAAMRIAADLGRWLAYLGPEAGGGAYPGDEFPDGDVPGNDDSGAGSPMADRRNGEGRE